MVGFFWLLSALALLTLILHLAARFWFTPRAAWMFDRLPWLPGTWYEPIAGSEEVEFSTSDGVRLRGTYLPTTESHRLGVLLYCHELNADRWNVCPNAGLLRSLGFDLFAFDFRNHGTSGRLANFEPSPWTTSQDVADVEAAIDYLTLRPDAEARGIGLIGVGKGAAAAVCTAAGDPRVRVVVAEGLYPTRPMGARLIGRFRSASWMTAALTRLAWLLDAWAVFVLGCRQGHRFLDVEKAVSLCRQPVLLVHAEMDHFVPLAWIRWMHRRMARGSSLWIVRGAKRVGMAESISDEYIAHVGRFLHRHWISRPSAIGRESVSSPAHGVNQPVVPATATAMPSA